MVEIKSFICSGFSSNVFVVRSEQNFLVDVGIGTVAKVQKYLKENDVIIDRIILTHRHYDHTADAKEMSAEIGAPLFASPSEAKALIEGDDHTIISTAFGRSMPKLDVKTLTSDSYAGFKILSTPGHTDGGISLYHPEEKILISGDTVFPSGGVGRTDLPTGNITHLKESVEKLTKIEVESLYSGHGPVVSEGAGRHIRRSLKFLEYY